MDAERWQRVRTILEGAFELSEAEHPAYLARVCGGDSSLRAEVEALLAADADAGVRDTLDGRLAGVGRTVAEAMDEVEDAGEGGEDSGDDPAIGLRIGGFRLVRRLGRGSAATVYLAEPADRKAPPVALKLIRTRFREDLLLRFRTERRILEALDHPSIARILGGGRAGGPGIPPDLVGTPYMVLEYVDGLPIDRYCDWRRLSVRDRLLLLRTVCEAVQHAHDRGLVHRDLKPGNLLVTRDGQAKLLDFGIAKVLDPEPSMAPLAVTRSDVRILSPAYGSPEQILGEPVTPASDVYSLGILLFELLTGRRPYLADEGLEVLIDRALRGEPPRPSQVVTGAPPAVATARATTLPGLQRQISGTLETVVLRALAREVRKRYPTAAGLGNDLERVLAGRSPGPAPGTLRYRLGSRLRRRPGAPSRRDPPR